MLLSVDTIVDFFAKTVPTTFKVQIRRANEKDSKMTSPANSAAFFRVISSATHLKDADISVVASSVIVVVQFDDFTVLFFRHGRWSILLY